MVRQVMFMLFVLLLLGGPPEAVGNGAGDSDREICSLETTIAAASMKNSSLVTVSRHLPI